MPTATPTESATVPDNGPPLARKLHFGANEENAYECPPQCLGCGRIPDSRRWFPHARLDQLGGQQDRRMGDRGAEDAPDRHAGPAQAAVLGVAGLRRRVVRGEI